MQETGLEREIWMMRADLRQVLNFLSYSKVHLKDIEQELWRANELVGRSGQSYEQKTLSE